MNFLFRLFQLPYSVARLVNNPRDAADNALYVYTIFFISPVMGVLMIFDINILPLKDNDLGNKLLLTPFTGIIILLVHFLIVKKFEFKKKARLSDAAVKAQSVPRKIANVFLMFFIVFSAIWIPIGYDLLTGRH